MQETRNVVFIGERFYSGSKTIMSSIYLDLGNGIYQRYDYGKMKIDERNGIQINWRNATAEEIEYFDKQLVFLLLQL